MSVQLVFDFERCEPVVPVSAPVPSPRSARSAMGYRAGLSAEDRVAADYAHRGYRLAARRWRGKGGEIDLVFEDGEGLVFVEVKKGGSFDGALAHLTRRQIGRLCAAAEEYAGGCPRGSLTDLRFDVALMDGIGDIRVIENAFAA